MNKLKLALAGAFLFPALAFAQVRASAGVTFDLPVVLPQLVVVSPGVQVVPECDHEVFYTGGYYWVREDDVWYRSRSHRGGWVVAPPRIVPAALVRVPPGHYKHWKPGKGYGRPGPAPAAYGGRDDRYWKDRERERKHEEKEWKHEEKERRHEEKHGGGPGKHGR